MRGAGSPFVAALAAAVGFGLGLASAPVGAAAQQLGDPDFVPRVESPAFAPGAGPLIALDEGHVNFHTIEGRFGTFAQLVRADGYRIEPLREAFSAQSLSGIDLLVIANALHPRNDGDWSRPTPSAFTTDEIEAVREWVEAGGALLLIADHMPFPGAAHELAAAFGFELNNGFAMFPGEPRGTMIFQKSRGLLADHAITDGSMGVGAIDSIANFHGEAFVSPAAATDLLVLPDGVVSLMTEVAWQFEDHTPVVPVGGWSQGSVLEVGEGRIAVFGEAAMFTAQRSGEERIPMGMNAPEASQNPAFVTALVRWLTAAPRASGEGG